MTLNHGTDAVHAAVMPAPIGNTNSDGRVPFVKAGRNGVHPASRRPSAIPVTAVAGVDAGRAL